MRRGTEVLFAMVIAGAAAATVFAADTSPRVPKPQIVIERGDECVEETQLMRREHMNRLKNQRDKTVHAGERQARYSLQGCVDCHASRKTGSVIGTPDAFCQSCHNYAAVKLDCFECHSPNARPEVKASSEIHAGKHDGGSP